MKIQISLSATSTSTYSLLGVSAYDLADEIGMTHIPRLLFPDHKTFVESVGYLANCLTRAKETITDNGEIKLANSLLSVDISLVRLSRSGLTQRGDYRYDAAKMAQFLSEHPKLDLPPIQVAKLGSQLHLLDGHHRYRAYDQADRDPLPYVVEIRPSVGHTPQVRFSVKV